MWKRSTKKSVCSPLAKVFPNPQLSPASAINTRHGGQAECRDHGSSGIVGGARRGNPSRSGLAPLEARGERHSQEAVSFIYRKKFPQKYFNTLRKSSMFIKYINLIKFIHFIHVNMEELMLFEFLTK